MAAHSATVAARRQLRGSCGGGGSAKADVGGSLALARRWRHTARRWQRGGSSAVAAAVAAAQVAALVAVVALFVGVGEMGVKTTL